MLVQQTSYLNIPTTGEEYYCLILISYCCKDIVRFLSGKCLSVELSDQIVLLETDKLFYRIDVLYFTFLLAMY